MRDPSLEYFPAISESSTLSGAAETIGMSQQGLSAYLSRLEGYYGMKLVERKPSLALTPAGARVLEAAREIDHVHRLLDEDLAVIKGLNAGVLAVAIFEPLTQAVMGSDVLDRFFSEHKGLSLELLSGSSADVVSLVSRDKADIGITTVSDLGDWIDRYPRLEFYWLSKNTKYLIGQTSLVDRYITSDKSRSDGIGLKSLKGIPLVLPYSATGINKRVRSYMEENGLPCNVVSEGRNDQMLSLYVARGRAAGICMKAEAGIVTSRSLEKISMYPILEPDLVGSTVLIHRKNAALPSVAESFIKELKTKWSVEG